MPVGAYVLLIQSSFLQSYGAIQIQSRAMATGEPTAVMCFYKPKAGDDVSLRENPQFYWKEAPPVILAGSTLCSRARTTEGKLEREICLRII
jgi:hypothetical protein